MYLPPAFAVDDREQLRALIRDHGFGLLVTAVPTLVATHLPLEWDAGSGGDGRLLGHISAANMQWRTFDTDDEALAVFQGPHTYISPTWYKSEKAVPTWNYAAVHCYGRPRTLDDESKHALLTSLVAHYESSATGNWSMDDLPEDYAEKHMKGVVAFEMPIERMEGKMKMSQNRPAEDSQGVIDGLRGSGDAEASRVADLVARCTTRES